jgi:hypothetical protein
MYITFKVLHIICASMTLALFPLALWFRSFRSKRMNTPAELTAIGMEFGIGRFMGMIGGLGLLVTGGAMTGIGHYPWFDYASFPWLAWKQTFYIIILAINFAAMVPVAKKIMPLIMARKEQGGTATDEIRALAARAAIFGIVMNLLTIINTILGTAKPNL